MLVSPAADGVLPYDASQPEQTTRKTLKVNGRPGLLPSRPLSTTPTPGRNPLIKFLSTLLWPSARLPAISALQGTEACIWEDSLVLQPGLALQRDGECPPPLDRVQCTYAASSWKPMNGRCAPVHVPTARIDPAKLDTRRSRREYRGWGSGFTTCVGIYYQRSRVLRPKSPSLKPRRIRPDCKIKVRNEKGNERRSGFRQALTDYSDFRDVVASDLVNIIGPQLLNEALSRAAVERGGRLG